MAELTAHRTLALRQALGERSGRGLCRGRCTPSVSSCSIPTGSTPAWSWTWPGRVCRAGAGLGRDGGGQGARGPASGLGRAPAPGARGPLGGAVGLDERHKAALFAHCAACAVNAVQETWNRRPRALAHAGQLAASLRLDMAGGRWTPTADNYLGRVTKARILEAVREAKGEAAAERLADLKKSEMAARGRGAAGWVRLAARAAAHPGWGRRKRRRGSRGPRRSTRPGVAGSGRIGRLPPFP